MNGSSRRRAHPRSTSHDTPPIPTSLREQQRCSRASCLGLSRSLRWRGARATRRHTPQQWALPLRFTPRCGMLSAPRSLRCACSSRARTFVPIFRRSRWVLICLLAYFLPSLLTYLLPSLLTYLLTFALFLPSFLPYQVLTWHFRPLVRPLLRFGPADEARPRPGEGGRKSGSPGGWKSEHFSAAFEVAMIEAAVQMNRSIDAFCRCGAARDKGGAAAGLLAVEGEPTSSRSPMGIEHVSFLYLFFECVIEYSSNLMI